MKRQENEEARERRDKIMNRQENKERLDKRTREQRDKRTKRQENEETRGVEVTYKHTVISQNCQ